MIDILSLGAGVQSSTVLLMSHVGELPPLDCAIFADTGWESKAVYDHLAWLEQTVSIPIHRVSAGNIRDDHLGSKERDGMRTTIPFFVDAGGETEGRTFRKCTKEYKIIPMNTFVRRELLGLAKGQKATAKAVRKWLGISVDEIQRMRPAREHWQVNHYPLVERRITRLMCLDWCEDHGFPQPPRSSCLGCPFHRDPEWRRLKRTDPDGFADAVRFDEQMRHNAAMSGTAYLHRSLVPLDQVDFRNDLDRGQLTLWQDECEGMCGV